jgi:hypothetical protein
METGWQPCMVSCVEISVGRLFQEIHQASGTQGEKMKEYLKVTATLIVFILGALGFLTLARNFNKQPSVILTSAECILPCWYGITPGKSTSSQVYDALERIHGVDTELIYETTNKDDKLTKIAWFFKRPVEDQMGSVNITNDTVTAVNISTVNSLTLDSFLNKAGEPEQYWTGPGQRDGGGGFSDIVLLAPSKGYAAELVIDIKAGSNQVEIKPDTPVFRVTYFSPEMYQELLPTHILIDQPAMGRTPMQVWKGYGLIPVNKN